MAVKNLCKIEEVTFIEWKCDVCGKKRFSRNDYEQLLSYGEIYLENTELEKEKYESFDICEDCKKELVNIIDKFLHKDKEKEDKKYREMSPLEAVLELNERITELEKHKKLNFSDRMKEIKNSIFENK